MNKKITDLTELESVANGDYIEIVDISDTSIDPSGSSAKISRKNMTKFPAVTLGDPEEGLIEYDGTDFYVTTA